MRHMLWALLLVPLLGVAPAAETEASDEKILHENNLPTEGPALVEHFRRLFTDGVEKSKLRELIEQLGDDSFAKREDATKRLAVLGPQAMKPLKEARRSDDVEIRYRASLCLKEIGKDARWSPEVIAAAVRLLAQRKPPGVVAALFHSLPSIDNENAVAEVRQALARFAVKDGKAHPVLVAGLKDADPLKRATAGLVLCQVHAAEQLAAIGKLLDDPSPQVRLPIALALVQWGHKEAVPVLAGLMDLPPSRELGLAEDVLFRLAVEKSPRLTAGDAASRLKYRKAWQAWWAQNESKVDLSALKPRILGHTTVVLLDLNQIVDLDAGNQERWKISNVEMALDVQRLSGEKVLLAEYRGNRVTERNRKGEVVWEKKIGEPLVAQRLPNGNTFIATKDGLMELDATGNKEVFHYGRPGGEQIMRARKVPGGDILLVTQPDGPQFGASRFVRLDRFGKELNSFDVKVSTSGGRIDLTPAGHVLIPELPNQRVVEYAMDGKIVRVLNVPQPITALALSNGHVLVTSMTQNRAVEFDRDGKEVWEYKRDTRVTRAVRP